MKLTPKETSALVDALDMVLQGMSEAWQMMIEDESTFTTAEEFLETLGHQEEDIQMLQNIRKKVTDDGGYYSPASVVRTLRARLQSNVGRIAFHRNS